MHVHCFHWLMSTDLLFPNAFCWPFKSMTCEMVLMESSNLAVWIWYGSHCLVHICLGFVGKYWHFVGRCECHSYSKLYYLWHLISLFNCMPWPIPPLHFFHLPLHSSHKYPGLILINLMKKSSKLAKISHYLLSKLVVHKLIDSYALTCLVNESKYKGKGGF